MCVCWGGGFFTVSSSNLTFTRVLGFSVVSFATAWHNPLFSNYYPLNSPYSIACRNVLVLCWNYFNGCNSLFLNLLLIFTIEQLIIQSLKCHQSVKKKKRSLQDPRAHSDVFKLFLWSNQQPSNSSFTLVNVKEQHIVLTVKDALWNFL